MTQSPYTIRTGIYPEIDPDRLTGSLTGKNALITGSGRGIGREIAIAMARAGANVCVTARTSSQVEETKAEIVSLDLSSKVVGIVADVLRLEDQERLVREFREQLGPVDVLVCNAGSNIFQPFHLTNATEWWDIMELNVRAPVELTRLVLPEMRERNRAAIIYTSSRAANADLPWTTAYNCAKTSISRFAGTLQVELDQVQKIEKGVDNNIAVFSIHPGEIETNLHETAFPEKTKREAPYVIEQMDKIGAKRPHFEAALPAWTCVWLSSGKGSALRGKFVDCTRDVGEQSKEANEANRAVKI
ncbi:peroxisomal short-chain alcohol dehydrogenase [Fusarium tjaetaba]|uniref:Peroxisomal short-chain alcohol dehydrogenase n=1 Tax=Fusarium tjaetaba TaxID=1567544 RepID=A0A8H5RCZ7_9HYPO|nr:peroxisomal short-chain alcohol dehydrogenase [Fusarium tjaetaba]KAF5630788.1 peroxisomal short-chain alcohol dehydrogenase [Fusarium tjaetaba]